MRGDNGGGIGEGGEARAKQAGGGAAGAGKGQAGPKKVEMVKQALAELGKGAKPLQIRAFVKDRFGAELNTNLISYYKKTLAGKRARKKKRAGPKAGGPPGQQPAAVPPAQARAPAAARSGISLDYVRLVKDLVARIGAEQLRTLIDLLAR